MTYLSAGEERQTIDDELTISRSRRSQEESLRRTQTGSHAPQRLAGPAASDGEASNQATAHRQSGTPSPGLRL
uniref:Uncharacterized protein n=1 Tax=Oryza sativa subsp. japonica TaxID=39947 RepID=Q6ET57_ORYSJ|nr:hypothetical protein [Oryza sativa Japonica Group]